MRWLVVNDHEVVAGSDSLTDALFLAQVCRAAERAMGLEADTLVMPALAFGTGAFDNLPDYAKAVAGIPDSTWDGPVNHDVLAEVLDSRAEYAERVALQRLTAGGN